MATEARDRRRRLILAAYYTIAVSFLAAIFLFTLPT